MEESGMLNIGIYLIPVAARLHQLFHGAERHSPSNAEHWMKEI
jgi:hypothetical protein